MQSLQSSCQEADFIINDTLEKLKVSNNNLNNTSLVASSATATSSLATTSGLTQTGHHSVTILRPAQQAQQLSYQHAVTIQPQQQQQQHNATQNKYQQQYHHLQNALQGSTTCSNAVVVAQQLSPPPSSPSLISTGYSGSFTSKSSLKDTSLLHCNISQIPSQPPLYIFDGDGDDETNPPDQPPAELLAPVADENISNTTSSNIPSAGSIRLESFSLLSSQKYRNGSNNNINSNMVVMPAPSPAPSMASLNNYNSITSPSPTVPDLLLSTPPGASAAAAVASATTSIFYSNKHHNNNNSSNNNNNKNNKKSDKRPSSTSIPSSGSTSSNSNNSFHHTQYHHNHIQTTITTLGTTQQQQQKISYSTLHQANASLTSTSAALSLSPTSSPSKRQKIKDYTSTLTSGKLSLNAANRHMGNMPTSSSVINSNKRSDLSVSLSQGGTLASYNSGSSSAVNISSAHLSSSTSASSSQRFINIHQAIKEQYVQLLANDLNVFASTGLKHRSRSFVLERVVQCEKLNTIVVNLYPGNKGYALAIHYDERHQLTAESESGSLHSLSCSGCGSGVSHYSEAIQLNTLSLHKNITSRPFTAGSHKLLHPSSNDLKGVGVDGDLKFETQEYALVEILRWPYENDQLLQCIDQEILPDFVMDLLTAPTVTLPALHDDTMATERIYRKPNVFYCGCVVAEVRDFRQTFATSTNICDTRHVLLRPTNASLYADIQFLGTSLNEKANAAANTVTAAASSTACAPEDKLSLESHIVLATAEPLCLDPDPSIGHQAINSQHERQIFNSHEMRRQMKKFTQIAINRKRKLDQFTHHYGLELYDYLTRLRSRPRSGRCAVAVNNAAANLLTNTNSFASKVPKRPHDIIRPISPPRLDYPPNLKVPDKQQLDLIEKYAKTNERPRETTDCHPILIEEYILETEREDNEGHRVIYHIKLSIFQRPSNSQYLGELYVDRDYREGEVNGESCSFPLGTRIHANRYIQQFTEIFTEEGRKAVKITHLVPGHLPKVTHTGITPEQRQALLLQQQQQLQLQQRQAALLAAQQQQQQQIIQVNTLASHQQHQQQQTQQHVVVVGPSGQQQHLLSATVHHVSGNNTIPQTPTPSTNQHQHLPQQQQHQQHLTKNINIVGITGHSAAAVQQVLRQHQQQQQQQQQQSQITATQYIEVNGNGGGGGQTPISNVQIATHSHTSGGSAPHIQLQQISTNQGNNVPGSVAASTNTTTTTHQLSLSNGSLVLVQHHPATNTGQTQATISQQAHQVLQHAGITIQPATTPHHAQQQQHLQQKTHIINATQLSALPATPSAGNSALRTQLSSNVPILQAQLKAAPIVTTATQQHHQQQPQQQHLLHKQQQGTTVHVTTTGNNTTTTLHSNPAINAIVTSIMNTANQWQQQHQQQQQQQKISLSTNTSSTTTTTTLKSSNNASILSLLNSAPAAMTSTPVASSTFTATTGQTQTQQQQSSQQHPQSQQQQTVTLVQHSGQQTATLVNTDSFIQQTAPLRKSQNEVLQNLLNPGRKINIVSSGGGGVNVGGSATATFRTNAAGNLIAVNLNQVPQQQHQQQLHHHHSQQQESSQPQPPPPPPSQTTVRVSMSALASQLASPPAIMTNSTNFGSYTLSTVSGGSGGNVNGGAGGNGSIKILNSGIQQQRVLANALRRDSLNAQQQVPPNAIVVGMAAPSPGSDSNASNASSGFAIPQAATSNIINNNNSSGNSTTLNALLANAATPSPSGSDHSQSSQTQNQTLLERLNSGGVVSAGACTVLPTNISPQQQHNSSQQTTQYITKTLVPSPATLSIHSPMSSPHPQSSPSPHLQQQQQQTSNQQATATATLNLQGINFSTLQGAMANFQNVQVQIPGFTQPISLQLTAGGGLPPQSGNATVSVVATGGPGPNNNNVSGAVSNLQQNSTQTHPTQARSLLVSVPVSNAQQQQQQPQQQLQHSSQQTQHTITLQPHQAHQVHQQHNSTANATNAGSSTIVNLPAGAVATATGATQTVLLANNSGGNVGLTSAGGNTPGGASGGSGTTMLTLPIAQLVGAAGVQKLNTPTLRTSNATCASVVTSVVNTSTTTTGDGGVGGGSSIILQQQSAPPTTHQQTISNATQQATITVTGPGGNTISHHNQAIQLVGTIQQGGRNIQVVGTKQLAGSRHLIAQRQIGNSTLKIAAATPIQAGTNAAINSATTNLTATPIVMSASKLQLKAIKPGSSTTTTTQQQQQQQQLQQTHPTTHQRLLNQITASQASQTTPQDMQQQQLTHTVQQQQQGVNKTQTVIMGQPQNGSGNTTHTLSTVRAASNLSQRAITAIVAAANRRRSATDVNK